MKLFECSNGFLVNPEHVSYCGLEKDTQKDYLVKYLLVSGKSILIGYDRPTDASEEVRRFKNHCSGIQ